jgi:hypothetical protein
MRGTRGEKEAGDVDRDAREGEPGEPLDLLCAERD